MSAESKILTRDQLREQVEQWRRAGERITLANGNFDLLHVGHVRYLRGAKALGRPIMPEQERAEIVSALADVDAVIVFRELDVRSIIREIRPDIQAKGTDYTADTVPERDVVADCGGRVAIVGDSKDHSTGEIIRSRLSSRKS